MLRVVKGGAVNRLRGTHGQIIRGRGPRHEGQSNLQEDRLKGGPQRVRRWNGSAFAGNGGGRAASPVLVEVGK